MKRFFLIILLLNSFVFADDFELVENTLYKYQSGIIYAVKNINQNRTCVIYSDSKEYAQVLYYDLYNGTNAYYNLDINLKNAKKRKFNPDSQLQLMQSEYLDNIDNLKACPQNICKTTSTPLVNHYGQSFLSLSLDDALANYVPDYKVKNYIKSIKKAVKNNLKTLVPKHSYSIALTFQVDTKSGNVENLRIINAQVLKKSEQKAYIKAVNKSAPYKASKEIANVYDAIPVKMRFNWNVRNF